MASALSIVLPAGLPLSAVPWVAAVHSPMRKDAIIGHLRNAAPPLSERKPPAAMSGTIVNGDCRLRSCNITAAALHAVNMASAHLSLM